jgi:hypothetical protein
MWQAFWCFSKQSATHAWANLVIALSAAIEVAAQLGDELADTVADLAGDPELKAQVLALVPHEHGPLVMIAIMIVTKMARDRTLVQR